MADIGAEIMIGKVHGSNHVQQQHQHQHQPVLQEPKKGTQRQKKEP